VEGGRGFTQGRAVVNGRQYSDALLLKPMCYGGDDSRSGSYNLGRDWSTLSFTAGLTDTATDQTMQVTVEGDGEVLLAVTVTLGQPEEVEIDVSDVLRLRISFSSGEPCRAETALAEPLLTR
jgi:hypothetical protein